MEEDEGGTRMGNVGSQEGKLEKQTGKKQVRKEKGAAYIMIGSGKKGSDV
jgi:hypothetical protein